MIHLPLSRLNPRMLFSVMRPCVTDSGLIYSSQPVHCTLIAEPPQSSKSHLVTSYWVRQLPGHIFSAAHFLGPPGKELALLPRKKIRCTETLPAHTRVSAPCSSQPQSTVKKPELKSSSKDLWQRLGRESSMRLAADEQLLLQMVWPVDFDCAAGLEAAVQSQLTALVGCSGCALDQQLHRISYCVADVLPSSMALADIDTEVSLGGH